MEDKIPLKVLFAEDDSITRLEVSKFLENKVEKLTVAQNGQEGLRLYQKEPADVVITDIRMPIMNGLDMVRAIKGFKKPKAVIVTTAYNETDLLIECIDLGVNKFLLKPLVLHKLEAILRDIAKGEE
ncbi:response regulator transcription factor [Thermospira aquatica]|uniref:Response regulator n=1 Tax=Thermospira aquatica TaxID=2828656 RepID=A0AAX3BFL1_9SPIR|nr:response regulator [Thermospira aquatica]URA11059.1 response regulator [Thermospira aquatica]